MTSLVSRRRLMQGTSSALAFGALSSGGRRVSAQSSGEVRAAVGGGSFAQAIIDAYLKPFEAETGIKVIPVTQDVHGSQIAMMVKSNSVTVDVVVVAQSAALDLAKAGHIEKIDYSIYKKEELEAILDYCKQPYGFGPYVYSFNMVYNTKKFPAGNPRPTNWAEFWDIRKFPGARSLTTGQFGTGPWEEALLADGVSADALYPMDIDRVFASLDKIKPHVRKWWANGSEILQIMRDDVADLMQSYDGRANTLIDSGSPIEISRNQAKLTWDYLVMPKGSTNAQNAQKLIEFTSRADRQAAFAQLFPNSPSNRNAFKSIPDNVARKLAGYPDYLARSYPINAKWYAEIGSDGLSNTQRLSQRWSEWILR